MCSSSCDEARRQEGAGGPLLGGCPGSPRYIGGGIRRLSLMFETRACIMFKKIPSSANNTLTCARQRHVHVRGANLLGSFCELSTLKLIYTGCTAAVVYVSSFFCERIHRVRYTCEMVT